MGYKGLKDFLKILKLEGELVEISAPVDPVLEVTEIYDRVVKKEGPALLFKAPDGSDMPLVINLFGSENEWPWRWGLKNFLKWQNGSNLS